MNWYKIDIDNRQISDGELIIIQDKFLTLYNNSGRPKYMTLLCDEQSRPGETRHSFYMSLYFSQTSFQYASQLISDYNGAPCEEPTRDKVAFLAGDREPVNLLRSDSSH